MDARGLLKIVVILGLFDLTAVILIEALDGGILYLFFMLVCCVWTLWEFLKYLKLFIQKSRFLLPCFFYTRSIFFFFLIFSQCISDTYKGAYRETKWKGKRGGRLGDCRCGLTS